MVPMFILLAFCRSVGFVRTTGGSIKTKSAFAFALFTVPAMALVVVFTALASENIAHDSIPIVKDVPSGYRDWKLISMAHEEGNLHSFAAVLGNDIAINAYREGKLPLPDGAIIVALHYRHVPSEENNKVFGQAQSFVPGPPTNNQFKVKDLKKIAATGGVGFGQFGKGKALTCKAMVKSWFQWHQAGQKPGFLFAHFRPWPNNFRSRE